MFQNLMHFQGEMVRFFSSKPNRLETQMFITIDRNLFVTFMPHIYTKDKTRQDIKYR